MQLGLTPWTLQDCSAQKLTEQAAFAESLGYQSFWLPESHFNIQALPDPLMLLAAVAAGTRSIRLATTSYLLPLRNPLLAAEQVAVLDQLCGGRLLLGVGRGYSATTLQAFDIEPKSKRELFESTLALMIRAWSGEPIATPGEGQESVTLQPLPVQQPHPPIWVAAFGPKALSQAGRLGLPYLASPLETFDELQANFSLHAEALATAGHEPINLRPVMRTVFVSDNAAEVSALKRRLTMNRQQIRSGVEHPVDTWAIVGDPEYAADRFRQYAEDLGTTHLIVTRLRIDGIEDARLRESISHIVNLV